MNQPNKILVIQTAFPGDAILTLPFIQELKKKRPGYLIDVLCIPSTADIFEASPSVNIVILFDKKGKQRSFSSFIKFIKELKMKNYEIVYSPHRSFRSALITLNLGAEESFGYENSSLKFAFKSLVNYNPSDHEVKRNLSFINSNYGDDKWKIMPQIVVSDESKKKVQDYLNSTKINKFIAVAPGSVWETKKYPVEYYKILIDHFVNKNYQIVLIGGEEDKSLCEVLQTSSERNVYTAAGVFSLVESTELLKNASLLICNDSAPTHLGMSADIPVLTIYCSTIPGFGFYPYNSKSDYISYDKLNCKPCGIHGFRKCPIETFDCAKKLTPDLVISKAEKLISNVIHG